jgi:hypothetical protein
VDFPTILYRVPGAHSGNGFTYDYAGALDQKAADALKAQGWHETLADAVSPPSVEPAVSEPEPDPEPDVPDDDAPPTRAELEAKANELGVKFDGRTSDAKLLAKIDAAIVALDPLRDALARLDSEEN